MIRSFEEHEIRFQKELTGNFLFVTEDGRRFAIPVPGCWEQNIELMNYRGKGSYFKEIKVKKNCNVRFVFKGISHTADVFFDGKQVGHHYNAYTGFEVVLRHVEAGRHELKIDVDNSFSERSALHKPNDYETFGGIIRPVVYEEVPDVFLKSIHFESGKSVDGQIGKTILLVENLTTEDKDAIVRISLAGKTLEKMVCAKAGGITEVAFEDTYKDVKEWGLGEPNLYDLNAELLDEAGEVIDDLIDRVGFRTIEVKGSSILLNGKKIFLKGFNRHEDYAGLGNAVPFQIMVSDLEMMIDMGGNAVRTCHYPNDERFLDLCDEKGILVWEENHARGLSLQDMENPNFDRQCEDCIGEMIAQHYNHPSIFIWGILNECASETEVGREKYKRQYDQIRSLDKTRPRTSATCRHFSDICLDMPEVVSINIYTGWYEDADVRERFEREMEWIKSTEGNGKPLIISEFGAAAVYGCRDVRRSKWSEERQADIIKSNLDVYYSDERVSGVFVWQFADCKVTEEEWFYTRARTHNNKGIVDEYRRPKLAYEVIKEYYHRDRG